MIFVSNIQRIAAGQILKNYLNFGFWPHAGRELARKIFSLSVSKAYTLAFAQVLESLLTILRFEQLTQSHSIAKH